MKRKPKKINASRDLNLFQKVWVLQGDYAGEQGEITGFDDAGRKLFVQCTDGKVYFNYDTLHDWIRPIPFKRKKRWIIDPITIMMALIIILLLFSVYIKDQRIEIQEIAYQNIIDQMITQHEGEVIESQEQIKDLKLDLKLAETKIETQQKIMNDWTETLNLFKNATKK